MKRVIKKVTMLLVYLLIILAPVRSQYLNVTDKVENFFSNPCTDKNHLVLAPGVLKAGGMNRACLSRFHPDGPARLLLSLLTEDHLTTTASRELPPGDGGCLDINVPQLPNTKADLIVRIQYPEAQCTWERRLSLRISSGRVLTVQTERARYRPGDVVRARVLSLKPDLTPSHGSIEEVWLEGPQGAWEGTRVAQWQRLRTRLGLAQLQHQLDALAPPGKWTLRATLEDGSQGAAVFWVGQYELPPFQLSVRHAPRVLRSGERLAWTVCVRYPWSEAVEGILVIRLRGAGGGGGGAGVRTAVQLRAPKACHRHAVAARRVGLGLHEPDPPDVLVADFSFQEEGTRIWQNTTVVSQVVDKPITLEFLTKRRAVISRGLPYKLKVKATRWDDKPASKEQIRVCRYPAEGEASPAPVTSRGVCVDALTDGGGVARITFAAAIGEALAYRFEAQLRNDSTTTASLTVRVRTGVVQAALGPLKADSRTSRTLVPLYVNTHVTTPLTVHFVVITRGGIIYRWGATTQCPTYNSNDQIYTAPRNYKCNDNYYAYDHDDTAQRDSTNLADYNNRPKRSFNAIEEDPNSIQTDTTSNPKTTPDILTKTSYNRFSSDFDPNSIYTDDTTSNKSEPYIEERRNENTKSTSPVTLTASQSQKYHTTLRSTKEGITPISTTKSTLQYPQRTTNIPIDVTYHQHWPNQYIGTNIPGGIPIRQHWTNNNSTTNIPTASQYQQHWPNNKLSTNVPAEGINHQYRLNYHLSTNIPAENLYRQHWPNNNVPTNIQAESHYRQHWPNNNAIRSEDGVINVTTVTSDALLERKLKVMLPIKISHQMCPDAHLIAYFYYNGELVSAAKHFEMDECFDNKVEATWLTRQTQPGSTVSLKVSSPGPALCALTVLDTSAKWVQPPPTTRELLMNNLKRLIEGHRNLTEYDAAGECFFNSDTPAVPTSSMELTSWWLASAGVRMLGGEAPRAAAARCETPPPAALLGDDPAPRSDFSEAWLWRVIGLGANGSAVATGRAPDSITRFEAGVTCVSKTGVAVSAPAVLQVFREFFIHADGPKRLRRGDSAIIRYRIFNYLYEPLSVKIQVLADPHIEAGSESQETACIAARASIARRVTITARVASTARLSLRASTVHDGHCPNATTTTFVSDEVIIKMVIEPEGVPVHEQKSVLLCANDSADHRQYNIDSIHLSSSHIEWTWPRVKAVPGTETLTLWITNDMTGPLLADADSLVTIPRGCGEQNMAQLATNLLALTQLERSSMAAVIAREHVARGFTRQLQYVHPSGGFSAFGPSDVTSSTWLTAFAVKHLRKAHQLLWPNLQTPPALIRAERWLLSQQMENGCFRNEGQVFHRELRGGLNEDGELASVGLTAYVITSLIDNPIPVSYRVLRSTLSCLRALPPLNSQTPTRVYAHALLAYAYMKIERYEEDLRKSNSVNLMRSAELLQDGDKEVSELLKVARRSGGYVWWEASSLSSSIEATSYALLALRAATPRDVSPDAVAALRWLASHRSSGGGFVSTQDTLVALEALTAWSSFNTPLTNLNVTVRSRERAQTVTLVPGVRIPDVMSLIPGERLSVKVQGNGCALVQATRSYHSTASESSAGAPGAHSEKLLSVQVGLHTDGPFDCDANQTVCFCAAVIEACVVWSGEFPEMALLEVWLPGGYGADAQRLYSQLQQPSTLVRRIELSPSGSRASLYLGARAGAAPAARGGHRCVALHAVGPRTRTRPAYARVMDYYVPENNDTQLFTIPEDCPPRISHDTSQYTSADNLFTKARSLDGDEILITDEFNFEDIPEGIPLEDPLYENLTNKEENSEDRHIDNVPENTFNKVINSTNNENVENFNHNTNEHQAQRVGNLDTFTLNNVKELYRNASSIKTNVPHNTEQMKHDQGLDINNINPALIINQTDNKNKIFDSVILNTNKTPVLLEKLIENKTVENPNLSDFHVIDTEKDLEVPTGVEGPIPSVVLPPKNFIPPQQETKKLRTAHTSRGLYHFYEPGFVDRRYFIPRGRNDQALRHFRITENVR